MATDPICGMTVDEKTAKFKSEHMGKTYYFCSQMCKTTFDKDPAKYTGGSGHQEHFERKGRTQYAIGLGWLIFNVRIIPDAFALSLIFLGSVMFSGMGMIISGLVKDVEAASAIGNAIAFPMMFLSGAYFPLEFTPSYIQTIAKVLPLTYFADGLRYAMLYKYPQGIYTNMAIVAVLAVGFIIIAAQVTRWKEK